MDDFALTSAERALLAALNRRGVRYLLIGLGAAVLQGAPVSTQDLDLWLERIEVVLTAHGLADFESEYVQATECLIDDVPVRVLSLDRIIASKRSTNRPKDLAALPALEATIRARAGGDPES